MFGPRPRFRPYSTAGTYGRFLGEVLLGRTARGDDVAAFEEAVKARTGSPYAVAMPQARIGIFMAIRALIRPGQKVVLSPYTIYDVVNMVICAGGVPVFADIERETCNVDPRRAAELLDDDTGAVLVTHLHGLAMELDELAEACRSRGVPLIEDAAQAFGARVGGRAVGTIGDAGIYSFGLYKNINALYGGMVVTRRPDLHERLAAEVAALPPQRLWPLVQRAGYALETELLTWPPVFGSFTYHVFRYAYLHDVESLNRRVREENNPTKKQALPEGRSGGRWRSRPAWPSTGSAASTTTRASAGSSPGCTTRGSATSTACSCPPIARTARTSTSSTRSSAPTASRWSST